MVAACALRTISNDFDTHPALLAAAPLLPLARLLSSSSEDAQKHALRALLHLSGSPGFPGRFAAAGAIPPLVKLLQSDWDSAMVQPQALTFLGLLAEKGRSDILAPVKSAGALPLLACLQTAARSEAVRQDAGKLLHCLTTGTPPFAEPLNGSPSTAASVPPVSAAGSPSTAAPTFPPTSATPQQQQQLPPRPRKSCWSCGATGVPLKKCSVCAVASYCNAGCQKADWKAHKEHCAGLKAGATGSGSSAAGGKK